MEDVGIYFCYLVKFTVLVYIFCSHLVYFVAIWYTFSRFGMLCEGKSGNPA
jgi:hypothetical protein